MSSLLDQHHPDVAALVTQIRAALQPSPTGPGSCSGRFELALLRVSHENRTKFQANLDTDLDWLTWAPEAAWVKSHVTDVEVFRAGPAGDRLRAGIGVHPLYAPGSERLIGGWLVRGSWIFVFLLSSAAKVDLPRGRNAATEVIKAFLLAVAHQDPHDPTGRPILRAHALDRILRNEGFAWEIYTTLTQTYALVDAAGRPFDALQPNAKDEWTLITFGAARGRDDTARRFLVNRLNRARSGNWPGNEAGLPRGFGASADPDAEGRYNLHPTGEQRHVSRPQPDPQQRWAVQTIAAVYDRPGIRTFAAAAKACGQLGITSRGVDERGQTIDKLSDLASAGRLLLTPVKIRAYCTGLLAHTETGVTPGQFSPGDRHQLTPRFPGDALGAVTYDIRVGRPEDHGWSWDVEPARWARILRKFWLPDTFEPDGWAWTDPADRWDWQQILAAAERAQPAQPRGRDADGGAHRPFSGMMRWSDGTHRHLLHCRAQAAEAERYEWRREAHTDARRSEATGAPYSMRDVDGESMSSWTVAEFHTRWSGLALELYEQLIADEPALAQTRLLPPPDALTVPDSGTEAASDAHHRAIARLRAQVKERRDDADALRLSASRRLRAGDERAADNYDRQATEADVEAERLNAEADRLAAAPPPPAVPVAPPKADFGTPAAVLAGLTGPYTTGPAPAAFRDALREVGAADTRLDLVDAATVRMTVTVRVRRDDGALASKTGSTLLRRSRPHTGTKAGRKRREAAYNALTRRWYYQGIGVEEMLALSGSDNAKYARRMMREHLVAGTPAAAPAGAASARPLPSQGLQAAIAGHPAAAARAAVWCRLHPEDPLPPAVDPDWAEFVADTYQLTATWTTRSPHLDHRADHRQDAVTVLSALPDPTVAVPVAHLAALMGIKVTYLTTISTELRRGGHVVPATLVRPGGWSGKGSSTLPLTDRTVALPRCPWPDCPSPVATGVLLLPELVLGSDTTVLCRTCLRPPTRNQRFPAAYGTLLEDRPVRTGAWAHCAGHGCVLDLGAGAGVLWRWDDTPSSQETRHVQCTPGRRM
ncbi:hypothetical protein [Geodermatophilus sp. FMUSA9-8]|uniref:hypothetical protein n=1 Tax=Geodermatophilus sp. FMUSA9-8 TaxID=3120155 RepID=UPI003008C55E